MIKIAMDSAQRLIVSTMFGDIGNEATKLNVRVVNKTAIGARTDAVNAISDKITATKTVIRNQFKVDKATWADQTAALISSGKPMSLAYFKARQVKKGVTVQVLKSSPRALIKHAFIATAKSGHRIVVWREDELMKHSTGKPPRPGFKYGRLPKSWRYEIHERTGPRIQDIYDRPDVMPVVLGKIDERLERVFQQELNFLLSKHR